METNKAMLEEWFDSGIAQKATHMIVVRDTFSHENYPVYVKENEDCREQAKKYDEVYMQRLIEVYDLRKSKESQFKGGVLVFNYGDENATPETMLATVEKIVVANPDISFTLRGTALGKFFARADHLGHPLAAAMSDSIPSALRKVLETDNVRAILDPAILDRPAAE